ncbi:hypothetical protein HZ326_24393 [Fusarium oxysporum f. sp. albedinis]|nr:hypothetical protein HZ326_24393 [Fusarium oxysporum f. sp. albedinis]
MRVCNDFPTEGKAQIRNVRKNRKRNSVIVRNIQERNSFVMPHMIGLPKERSHRLDHPHRRNHLFSVEHIRFVQYQHNMPEEPPRRRGRPRKVHTEEERLAAQREHSQKYRQRVQQDKGESLSFAGYYQHIPYVPTSSSAVAQLPPHIILPNDSCLPLDLSCGDPGQPSSLSYGDNTAAHDGPSYDLGGYCPFDSDSTTSHESTASSASTRDCQTICGSSFMGNSTYFYEQAGLADSSAFDLTIAQFALGFIGTVLSWPSMARVGRRKIYVWGLFLLTVILLVTGCLGIPPKAASRSWGIGSLLLVYTFTYDITVGPVCYSLVAELPSSRLRQRTIVLARNAYNIVGVAYTNIIGLYSLNPTAWNWGAKSAFFWAGNCALCFVWAYFRLPEPKDRSYAELDMLFDQGVSARKFATTYVNPYETERRSGQDSDSKGKVMSHVE